MRRNFFAIGVVEKWNAIPAEIKAMESNACARYKQQRAQIIIIIIIIIINHLLTLFIHDTQLIITRH